jgi:hypothetical protein
MAVSWRRGLFQVWVVFSALWVLGVASVAVDEWRTYPANAL